MASKAKRGRAANAVSAGEKIAAIMRTREAQVIALLAGTVRSYTRGQRLRELREEQVRRRLIRRIAEIMQQAQVEARETALRELAAAYRDTAARLDQYAKELDSYMEQITREITDAMSESAPAPVPSPGGADGSGGTGGPPPIDGIDDIMQQLDETWTVELRHMRRDVDDVYRQVIEAAQERRAAASAPALSGVKDALNHFADKGVTGFVDRAGRHWGLAEYTDMAMRTAIMRVNLKATVDKMLEHKWDLCFVNSHMGACPKCQKWQGVVMSLTGRTPGYPTLQQAMDGGLFHPNCAHILQVYILGVSRLRDGVPEGYTDEKSTELYKARQKQRAIEVQIRRWKRRLAAAITDDDIALCKKNIAAWQAAARQNAKGDVQRRYDREQVRVGDPTKV